MALKVVRKSCSVKYDFLRRGELIEEDFRFSLIKHLFNLFVLLYFFFWQLEISLSRNIFSNFFS